MQRGFYDLDIQSEHSAGEDSVADLARRAEKLGFDGIAISDYVLEPDDLEPVREALGEFRADIEVRLGAKLRPDSPGELKEMLNAVRERADVVVVHGGEAEINRAACEEERVDILAHPELERKDSGLDHVMARLASDNNVAIEIDVRQLIETYGKVRSHVLNHMRRNVMLCENFDTPVVASSGARKVSHLRAPRELAAFPRILGMDLAESFDTVSENCTSILERADRVGDEGFVRPGVTEES